MERPVIKKALDKIREELLSLVYPKSCFNCQRALPPQDPLCLCIACQKKLLFNLPPFCTYCGIHIDDSSWAECSYCLGQNFHFKRGYTVFQYEGLLREGLHRFKYQTGTHLGSTLACFMINFAEEYIEKRDLDLIVPVPLHWAKLRHRGFNQSSILASSVSKCLNIPYAAPVKRLGRGLPQVGMARRQRIVNIQEAFRVTRPRLIFKKNILLVDDVFTTGATLNECSRVMIEAGAKKVQVFTLARGVN